MNALPKIINASQDGIHASQKMMNVQEKNKLSNTTPWWRQRWPWLLMAGPAVVIVGCIVTIVLAFQGFSEQAIFDGGMKRGLVVEKATTQAPLSQLR